MSLSMKYVIGYALRHGIEMMTIGGADLTKHVTSLLQKPDLRLDVARDLKEQYAIVASSPDQRLVLNPVEYELPDGE